MALFFVTWDNCDFVKRAVRTRLTQVKSSHLTEALAAAFGYRTHAALRAASTDSDAAWPPLVAVDAASFNNRLRDFGYESTDPAVLIEIARAVDLPVGVWREFRNGDRDANDSWFYECERRNIPNVYIERRIKYAKVNWDCISIEKTYESHVREEPATTLMRQMFRRYQALAKGDPAKSEFLGSAFVGRVDRLSPHVARTIADDIFLQLYKPMTEVNVTLQSGRSAL